VNPAVPSASETQRRRFRLDRTLLVVVAVVTMTGVALTILAARFDLPRATPPPPFTRESALSDVKKRYPSAELPQDQLPENVSAEENIGFDSRVSPPLALDVYRPRGTSLAAAVLVVHGGGWERGSRAMERPFAKRLAAQGFVAVPVSYRLGEKGRFPNALFDLKAAVRFLRANAERFGIDAEHVGALGGSSGGQLVALLGATNGVATLEGPGANELQSSAVQAVVDIDGLADFTAKELVEKETGSPGAPTRFLGGGFRERTTTWRTASALTHAGPNSAPTLFINSTAPTPILPGRQALSEKLLRAGVESSVVTLPDTPHPFWLLEPWFEPTLREAARFLKRHLDSG
jgi:acetyl esterase/lipase